MAECQHRRKVVEQRQKYEQALNELGNKNARAVKDLMKESDDKFITENKSNSEAAQELIEFAEAYIEVGKSANASLEDIAKGISFVTKAIELLEDQGDP